MAKKIEITVDIDKQGNISADVASGPGGKGCLDALDEILSDVGEKKTSETKPEIYRTVLPVGMGRFVRRG